MHRVLQPCNYLLVGSLLYLVGTFGVTIAFNCENDSALLAFQSLRRRELADGLPISDRIKVLHALLTLYNYTPLSVVFGLKATGANLWPRSHLAV
jgi:hypothetical protein